jgi:hypothetical protein
MEFLLPKEQLKGLSPEEQKAVKDEAFNQFLLGSIFGGGGIATGYQAVQNIIPNIQKQRQQQGLLQELGAIQNEFFPTQTQAGQRAFVNQPTRTSADFGPSPEAALRQQQILSAGPNYADLQTRLAKLALNPAAAPLIPSLQSSFGAFKPNITDGIVTDIRNRPTAVIPRADLKSGLTLTGTVQDGNVAFNTGSIPGYGKAIESNLTYALQAGEIPLYDRAGNLVATQPMPGSAENLRARKRAEAEGGAFGIPETVIDPVTKQKVLRSRAEALGLTTPTGARGATSGGLVVEASPEQQTLDAATNARYLDFSKKSLESADSAGGRKIAAEQLYDLATQINNNKLTGLQAGVYSYMNAIPGVGKLFEQDITDVTRMNQMIKTAQLEKTAMQKGSASNLDATTIEKSYASITDPASSTRMAAAFEVALADKDIAKNQFVEAYKGDPGKISTAWQNSPDNKPLFNHPKFNQFLTEQVNSWVQGGAQGKPVLPAGFQLGTGKTSGSYLIKRPDGSIYRIGQ